MNNERIEEKKQLIALVARIGQVKPKKVIHTNRNHRFGSMYVIYTHTYTLRVHFHTRLIRSFLSCCV